MLSPPPFHSPNLSLLTPPNFLKLNSTSDVILILAIKRCAKSYMHHSWEASVRYDRSLTRTFLYLEQLILKHNAHKIVNIKEVNEVLILLCKEK